MNNFREELKVKRKKILIISHNSFSLHSNNGKTLSSIFDSWGPTEIAQLYFQDEVPESKRFKNFFRVRDLDIIRSILSFNRPYQCGHVVESVENVNNHYSDASVIKILLVNILRRTNVFKLFLRDAIYGTKFWRSDALFAWLNEFGPDSIFFVGGNSRFSFLIANELAKKFRVPLDIYITDDYVLNSRPQGIFSRFLHARLVQIYHTCFDLARHVFVIGDDMGVAFGNVFGREFIPIMNSVSFPLVLPARQNTIRDRDYLDVVYAGGLHLGRDQSLVEFSKILLSMSEILGVRIQLTVYSTQPPSKKLLGEMKKGNIIFGGPLHSDELKSRLIRADFALHVESFESQYTQLTKLSISTKLPEYFAAGVCLIAFGPAELASIRMVKDNAIGLVLTEDDSFQKKIEKLQFIFESIEERDRLASSGFRFGKNRFDVEINKKKMEKLINNWE